MTKGFTTTSPVITDWKRAAKLLAERKIGVIPTDTIYGISCLASDEDLVEYVYDIKKRDKSKPFIILISCLEDLEKFGVNLSDIQRERVGEYWPGPVSIIFDVIDDDWVFLHRGKSSLAFRLPAYEELADLIKKTGPLVSTSANISEDETVINIKKAIKVFGNSVDFYLDGGNLVGCSSRVIRIDINGITNVLR